MSYLMRTKFKKDIISEFLSGKVKTNKVIIFCSGMPSYPNKEKYTELSEYFSKKGYFVFIPRYRGSFESGGEMFKKSPHLDILDIMNEVSRGFTDLWSGKKYKIENPEFYLFGSSFGGPAVLLNSTDKRVKKVVAFSPVLDWRYQKETIEPISKLSRFVKEAFGMGYRIKKGGWKKLQKGKMYNPATELEKIAGGKCLIFHAKDDNVVSEKPLNSFTHKTGTRLFEVKNGGHLGMAVLEKRFTKKVLDFLAK